ncbi:MAG: cadmium-translocating P-type ATPase [Planctomycetota bacterium]|nr:MAG: cadmium-translocating P-type ATPase [Planctomycetota bacterium]
MMHQTQPTGQLSEPPAMVDATPAGSSVLSRAAPPISAAVATALCALMGLLGVALRYAGTGHAEFWAALAWVAAYVAGGLGPLRTALAALRRGHLNVDLLMIVAAAGAAAIGDWIEGVVLLFLFSLSGALEAFAMFRTTRSIDALVRLRPDEATIVSGERRQQRRVPVESLTVGDVVSVRPGERYPVDGVVTEGETWADESTLTGESEPIAKSPGSQVFAGAMNGNGSVLVQLTKPPSDTTLQRIIRLVEEAQAQKTPTQRFVESWQRPYVIGVLSASLVTLVAVRIAHAAQWYDAFYHAMVLLVAASPCAVVVGSPAVMLSAIARAARHGVLFKSAVHLESLGRVNVIAFDKTGTLTTGKPIVTDVWSHRQADAPRLLALAATVEQRSEHPLAAPILEEARRRGAVLSTQPVKEFHSHTGLGVHARVDGVWVGVGREGLFDTHDAPLPPSLVEQAQSLRDAGRTALLVMTNLPQLYGIVAVADQIRPEAAATIAALKRLGIGRIVVLTGDHAIVGQAIARQVKADEVRAGLLPEQKVVELRRLAADREEVAMVGDGVNDAPALAAARVGIAMGGAGTDVALEVADVVLMRDDLRALPLAVWISRLACRRVRQNMIFAFAMIGVLVLSSFFSLPLWLGVLGHEGSTVIVVFNGLRLLWQRLPELA